MRKYAAILATSLALAIALSLAFTQADHVEEAPTESSDVVFQEPAMDREAAQGIIDGKNQVLTYIYGEEVMNSGEWNVQSAFPVRDSVGMLYVGGDQEGGRAVVRYLDNVVAVDIGHASYDGYACGLSEDVWQELGISDTTMCTIIWQEV